MGELNTTEFLDAVPAAKNKLLIDMINCIDVADGHLRVAKERENTFLARALDGLSGKAQRRGNAIAEHQQTALRNVIDVTKDLARSMNVGHQALSEVRNQLDSLEESLARVAHVTADQREVVRALRADMGQELARVDKELARLDMHAAAQDHIQWVFSRWDAGAWQPMPLASRCYVAMNELYWGVFGEYLHRHPGQRSRVLLETMQNYAIARMQRDAGVTHRAPLALRDWLTPHEDTSNASLFTEGLAWLGNQHTLTGSQPIAYLCTQRPKPGDKLNIPTTVPRLLHAERLAGLVSDVFFDGAETQHAQ